MKKIVKIIILTLTSFMIPELLGSIVDGLIGYFFDWYHIGLAIALCSTVLVIVFCKRRHIKILETKQLDKGIIYLIPIIASIILTIVQLKTNQRTYEGLEFGIFSLAIMSGVSEEVAFRAVPQAYAMKVASSKKDIWQVVLTTSILFALLHLTNAFGGVRPAFVIYQTIGAFCFGIFFSAIFLRTKNILLTIVAHAVNNFVAFLDASSTANGLITSKTFTYLDYIDMVFCLIYLALGIYLLRPKKQDETINLWTEETQS